MLNPGVDLRMLRERLESRVLETFVCPCGAERPLWPAGRSESLGELLFGHMTLHGVPTAAPTGNGVIRTSSCKMPCIIAGLAFAHWELDRYEQESKLFFAIRRLEIEASVVGNSRGKEARQKAARIYEALLSQPLLRELEVSRGRPPMPLADAICMHLDEGGFGLDQICYFVGFEPTRQNMKRVHDRLVNDDFRSLLPYREKYRRDKKPPGEAFDCNCDFCGSAAKVRRNNHFLEMMRGPNHADKCWFRSETTHWPQQVSSAGLVSMCF